jgi:acetyl esterase/lipase
MVIYRCLAVLGGVLVLSSMGFGQTTQPTTQATAQASAERIKLWEKTPGVVEGKDTDTDPTEPTMDIYLPAGAAARTVGIVVLPGGGYTHLSTIREGSDVAKMLNAHGIAAFVVRYRHAPRYEHPIPMLDGQRAMRIVRARAEEWHVDAKKIGVLGFSAGGHLAATLATEFDGGNVDAADAIDRVSCRPDFAVLLYPVITMTDEVHVHKGSRTALLGGRKELWAECSPEQHVTKNTPPVFLAHASPDRTVPVENSVMFYMACRAAGVPAEMHLFEIGSHGFGLAPTDAALRVWPELMVNWLSKNKWI